MVTFKERKLIAYGMRSVYKLLFIFIKYYNKRNCDFQACTISQGFVTVQSRAYRKVLC